MAARRHHYVPKCYLLHFSKAAAEKKKREIVVFDAVEKKKFATATDNVALERDFNTIELEGHEPDAFEKAMASVEGEIGPALVRIIEVESLKSENDRILLLNLISLLFVRNPKFREVKRDFHERVQKMVLDVALSSKEMWESQFKRAQEAGFISKEMRPDYEKIKKDYAGNNFKSVVPIVEHIRSEMEVFDRVVNLMAERKWVLVKAPEGSAFITCDHPVSLMWSEPSPLRVGLKFKGTEVLFPLSPKLAVVGAYELENGEAEFSDIQVASANGTTVLNAARQVYSIDDTFKYQIDQKAEPRPSAGLFGERMFAR